jgi:flavin-dependent thymidylate synthase
MTEHDKQIQRWADPAMYAAKPLQTHGESVTPKVYLISMTHDPLRVMAAAAELYRGGVYHHSSSLLNEQCLEWLDGFKKSKISAPMEFIQFHFLIEGVTRAFTHQLVRQRTAVFVQESMRFAVKEDAAFEVALPPSIANTEGRQPLGAEDSAEEWQRNVWDAAVEHIAEAYLHLVNSGMPAEDARGILPTNITTRIHYHTDLRNLVAQAGNRLCSQAQHEWKIVWARMIEAIINYDGSDERWQQREIVKLFKPVCFQTGKCEFMSPADRWCVIRDRVERHHEAGDPPDTWVDIDPREPLHHMAARRPQL